MPAGVSITSCEGTRARPVAGFEHQPRYIAAVGAGGDGDIFELAAQLTPASVTGVPSSAVRLTRMVCDASACVSMG